MIVIKSAEEEFQMQSRYMPTSCLDCENAGTSEWCCLKDPELRLIDSAKTTRHYSAGAVIYEQGGDCDGIHCLKSGLVGIRRLDESGNTTLLRLVYPGKTLGYRSFLRKALHDNSAEVLMPSTVCLVGRSTVRALLEKNPELGLRFLDHSLRELKDTEDRYLESITWKAKTRLLHVLLVLNERFGSETEDGEHRVELPVSRQDLAELVGTAPETMSRIIHRIQNEGLARFDGRTVHLLDLDAICSDLPVVG